MIPSLNLKVCESCSANCIRCDYSSTINGKEIHTINPRVIIDGSNFKKRCRVCSNDKVLNPNGLCEDSCDIANCKKCVYGIINDPDIEK